MVTGADHAAAVFTDRTRDPPITDSCRRAGMVKASALHAASFRFSDFQALAALGVVRPP
jgi:hypothetical protein